MIQNASDPPTENEIAIDKRLNRWPVSPPWKAGDEVEIDIIEKGEYLNFKVPKKDDLAVAGVQELEKRVKKLESPKEAEPKFRRD